MVKVTQKRAKKYADMFKINLKVVSLKWWTYALNVELEHGYRFGKITNVTNNSLIKTSKIAIAHLIEAPDYYQRLKKMEERADKYWEGRSKPNIFMK